MLNLQALFAAAPLRSQADRLCRAVAREAELTRGGELVRLAEANRVAIYTAMQIAGRPLFPIEIANKTGLTRQTINVHLRAMLAETPPRVVKTLPDKARSPFIAVEVLA